MTYYYGTTRRPPQKVRIAVEQAIARSRGDISTTFLMNAYGLSYYQVQAIRGEMVGDYTLSKKKPKKNAAAA